MIPFQAPSCLATLSFILPALIALTVTGCQPQKQTGPPEKITIAYSTAFNAVLVHIAFAKGYFKEEGLKVTPQSHAFGKPVY
jgi:ABC-type nitrate/sulfonate/bicarbonate transport system substrate-binding protein